MANVPPYTPYVAPSNAPVALPPAYNATAYLSPSPSTPNFAFTAGGGAAGPQDRQSQIADQIARMNLPKTAPVPISTSTAPTGSTATTAGAAEVPFYAILAKAEAEKGSPLTPQEQAQLHDGWSTDAQMRKLSSGAKPAQIKAWKDLDDQQFQQFQAHSATAAKPADDSLFGTDTTKGVLRGAYSTIPTAVGALSRTAAGVADLEGYAPNAVSEWLNRQADPSRRGVVALGGGASGNDAGTAVSTGQQYAENYAHTILGSQYGINAKLTQELIQQGLQKANAAGINEANGTGGESIAGHGQLQESQAYREAGAAGGSIGTAGGQVLQLLAGGEAGKAGDLPEAAASIYGLVKGTSAITNAAQKAAGVTNDAAKAYNLITEGGKAGKAAVDALKLSRQTHAAQFAPAALLAGSNQATEATTQAINNDASVGQATAQQAIDTTLGTVFNLFPIGLSSASKSVVKGAVTRAIKGGAAGQAESAIQQSIDSGINPTTTDAQGNVAHQGTDAYNPVSAQSLIQTGIQAALAVLLGRNTKPAGGNKPLKSGSTTTGTTTTTGTADTTVPPADGGDGTPLLNPHVAGKQAQKAGDGSAAAYAAGAAPIHVQTSEYLNRPVVGNPVSDTDFNKLKDKIVTGIAAKASTSAIKNVVTKDNAASLLATSENYAQHAAGETWDSLTIPQRADIAGDIAQKLGAKHNIDGISDTVEAYKTAAQAAHDTASTPAPAPEVAPGTVATETPIPTDVAQEIGGTQVPGTAGTEAPETGGAATAPAPVDPGTLEAIRGLQAVNPNAKDATGPVNRLKYGKQLQDLGYDPTQVSKAQAVYILGGNIPAEQLRGVMHVPGEAPAAAAPIHAASEIHNVLEDAGNEPTTVAAQGNRLKKTAAKIKAQQDQQAASTATATAARQPAKLTATAKAKAVLAQVAQHYFEAFTTGNNPGYPHYQELKTEWDRGKYPMADVKARNAMLIADVKAIDEGTFKPTPSNVTVLKPQPNPKLKNLGKGMSAKGGSVKEPSVTKSKPLKAAAVETPAKTEGVPKQEHGGKLGLKKAPATEETPPPKQEAPAKVEAGAQQEKEASKPESKLSVEKQVRLLTKGADISPAELKDLVTGVDLAHDGNPEPLRETLKGHRESKTLTPEQIKAISKLAIEKPVSTRDRVKEDITDLTKEAVEANKESSAPDEYPSHEAADVKDVAEPMKLRMAREEELGEELSNEPTPLHIQAKIDDVNERARNGTLTNEEARAEVRNLREEAQTENQRGSEWVTSRLDRMLRNSDEGAKPAIRFAQWLLRQNPNLAKGLGIGLKHLTDTGRYVPDRALVFLAKSGVGTRTIVHEILHHVERMLPPEIQEKIRAEYDARMRNKQKQADATNDENLKGYLDAVRAYNMAPTEKTRVAALDYILKEKVHPKEYKYLNPSEYWAETGSQILRRNAEAGSWIAKARNWMQEYIEHAKNLLGWDNTSAVYKGLREALGSEGEQLSSKMLDKTSLDRASIEKPPEEMTDEDVARLARISASEELDKAKLKDANAGKDSQTPTLESKKADIPNKSLVTRVQQWVENLALRHEGVNRTMEALTRAGIHIGEANDIFKRIYNGEGLKDNYNKIDMYETYEPLNNLIHETYANTHTDPQEFMNDLNDFYLAKNWLTFSKYLWTRDVPLLQGKEVDRQQILDDFNEGKISPEAKRKGFEGLASRYAAVSAEDYMRKNGVPVDKLKTSLQDLAKKGMHEESMKDINDAMQPIRDRTTERLLKSGDLSPDDIRLRDSIGNKWYAPIKGPPDGVGGGANADILHTQGINLRGLNKQVEIAQGRRSEAEKPVYRLIVDMRRAGKAHSMLPTMEATYNATSDANDRNNELQHDLGNLRKDRKDGKLSPEEYAAKATPIKSKLLDVRNGTADVHVYEGSLAKGFTSEDGETVARLPVRSNTLVYHDGDTHYVMDLNPDGQLLRGMVLYGRNEMPGGVAGGLVRGIGAVTNVKARLATTVNIPWDTAVQFIRQWTFTPMLLAAAKFDSPLKAAPFVAKNILNNVKMMGGVGQMWSRLTGDYASLKAYAQANPDSPTAWVMDYEAHGGELGHQLMFNQSNADRLFLNRFSDVDLNSKKALKQIPGIAWQKLIRGTGRYLSTLDLLTRAGSYKTLVDEGVSKQTAAAQVRATLDYSTAGRWSGTINSLIHFSRTAFTSADAARRAFVRPDGSFDGAKFAKWHAYFAAVGAGIAYPLINMLMGKDKDGKDKMAQIDPDTMTQKFVFPMGDQVLQLPIGQGLPQVLLAPGTLLGAYQAGHITWGQAVDSYREVIRRNLPLQPSRTNPGPLSYLYSALGAVTPSLAKPAAEEAINLNAFGMPIHPANSNKTIPNAYQGFKNTPQDYKNIAQWVYDTIGLDVYPEDIRYISQSYGGSLTTDLLRAAMDDREFLNQGLAPPKHGLMGATVGKFVNNDPQFYLSRELYKTLDDYIPNAKRYNVLVAKAENDGADKSDAKSQADQIVAKDPAFAKGLKAYIELNKAYVDYKKQVDNIRNDKLMSDERKAFVRKQLDSGLRTTLQRYQ